MAKEPSGGRAGIWTTVDHDFNQEVAATWSEQGAYPAILKVRILDKQTRTFITAEIGGDGILRLRDLLAAWPNEAAFKP